MSRTARAHAPSATPATTSQPPLPPELAGQVADVVQHIAQPAANAPANEGGYYASREGLANTVEGLMQGRLRDMDIFSYLLTSIAEAARQDAEWVAALCEVGGAWAQLERGHADSFASGHMASALAAVRAQEGGQA